MIALQGHKLQATYIAEPIFTDVNFTIGQYDKVGLVGANGAGKTTLFRAITGEISFEEGRLSQGQDLSLGYLEQNMDFPPGTSLMESVMSIFEDIFALWDEIHDLTQAMADAEGDDLHHLMEAYAIKVQEFEDQDGYSAESKARGIIRGLGFSPEDEERDISSFSGGEKTRLKLARLLVREPEILLLDEPTNHLDIEAVEWLEGYLKKFQGSLLIISHDRYFLDQVVDRIFELAHKTLKAYKGNYSQYLRQKHEDMKAQHKAFLKQQQMVQKEKAYIDRNRAGVNAKQARGREKRLQKVTLLEDVSHQRSMQLFGQETRHSADIVLHIHDLAKSYDEKRLFSGVDMDLRRGVKAGLIGPNGIGKSTLLKMIAGQVSLDSGSIQVGNRVRMAYYDQEQAQLNPQWTVFDQIIRTTPLLKSQAQDALARMLFYEKDWEKPIHLLSGGERGRLGLLLTLLEEPNFILMDEPTNHLDIPSKEIVEAYLQDFTGTLLIVSHDRYFLNAVTDQTYLLGENGLQHYLGNYAYYKEKEAELARKVAVENSQQKAYLTKDQENPSKVLAREKNRVKKELSACEERIANLELDLEEYRKALEKNLGFNHDDYARLGHDMENAEHLLAKEMDLWAKLAETMEEMEEMG